MLANRDRAMQSEPSGALGLVRGVRHQLECECLLPGRESPHHRCREPRAMLLGAGCTSSQNSVVLQDSAPEAVCYADIRAVLPPTQDVHHMAAAAWHG